MPKEGSINIDNRYVQPLFFFKDHLGTVDSEWQMTDTPRSLFVSLNIYYPFGHRASAGRKSTLNDRYQFNGKERQTVGELPYTDYGWRMYNPLTGRWNGVDQLSTEFPAWSPFAFNLNNPVKYVDMDGRKPRIFLDLTGVGHVFVTTGEGTNTTVYSYGRYGEIGSSGSTSGRITPKGEGVLMRFTGQDALDYIEKNIVENGALVYEVPYANDEIVARFFDDKFEKSSKIPTEGTGSKYPSNSRVIDTYNLFKNNCTTISIQGINNDKINHISPYQIIRSKDGNISFKIFSPQILNQEILNNNTIEQVDPDEYLKKLHFMYENK